MRRILLLYVLAGCGRLDFSSQLDAAGGSAGKSDAPPDALQCAYATTAPDPLTISGTTFRYTSFNNQTAPVGGVLVVARVGPSVVAQTTSDSGGVYSLSVPTGGVALRIEIEQSVTGYLPTVIIPDAPLDRDITGMGAAIWALGDGPMWNSAALDLVYGSPQPPVTRDPNAGTLNVAVRTCGDQALDGVVVELSPAPERLVYLAPDGSASPTLTATGLPYTHAVAFNAMPAPTHITASKPGYHFVDQDIQVHSMANTLAIVHSAE